MRKTEKRRAGWRLIKEAGLSERDAEEEAARTADFYTFNIPREFLWDEVTRDVQNLPERLAARITSSIKTNSAY